jgi:hypothetical protein
MVSKTEIDAIDDLDDPQRRELGAGELWRFIQAAYRTAMSKPVEYRYEAFCDEMVWLMGSKQPPETVDGWARLGAYEGATATWRQGTGWPAVEAPGFGAAAYVAYAGMGAAAVKAITTELAAKVRSRRG